MTVCSRQLRDAAATAAAGALLARRLANSSTGAVVYLLGDLGAGKTSFARGVLQALGVEGTVRSPTYTLMEPYRPPQLPGLQLLHMDLYRLHSPDELWELGLDGYAPDSSLWLVEWPERGAGVLPAADLTLTLEHQGAQRLLKVEGRVPWLAEFCSDLDAI